MHDAEFAPMHALCRALDRMRRAPAPAAHAALAEAVAAHAAAAGLAGEALGAACAVWRPPGAPAELPADLDAALGGPASRLIVYGSLAPGAQHAEVLAPLEGRWSEAAIRGRIDRAGPYPVLHPDPAAAELAVQCCTSPALPAHWRRIDAFEGPGYARLLVPARMDGAWRPAYVYGAAPAAWTPAARVC